MKTKKTFTKRAYIHRSFRLPAEELRRWQVAAAKLGVSQTEFVRHAIQERAVLVLESPKSGKTKDPALPCRPAQPAEVGKK